MAKMISLALSKKEAKDEAGGICCDPEPTDLPRYPYGTSLYFDDETLVKLGIDAMPAVGVEYELRATCKVTGTQERATQDGSRKTLDLQITEMAPLAAGDAARLYPSASDGKKK